jgi:hypothetical protein
MIINMRRDGSLFDPKEEESDSEVLEVLNEVHNNADHGDGNYHLPCDRNHAG